MNEYVVIDEFGNTMYITEDLSRARQFCNDYILLSGYSAQVYLRKYEIVL